MKCPFCKQEIDNEAEKCHFCKEFVQQEKNPLKILKKSFCRPGFLGYFLWIGILIFSTLFSWFITGWCPWAILIFMFFLVAIAIAYNMRYEVLLTFLSLCLAAIAIKLNLLTFYSTTCGHK